ncbi:MAG TPA: FaeA/PapI family transcriptional regulator, partial [Anaerolineaceae bacterium]|nr:FaeA/PapI family transcriptional regulator [Anaerolineaceae bacterium]
MSPRHKKILAFLEEYQQDKGYPPSIREIGDHTQISSTSVVKYYLNQLEEMGYIERRSNVSRGINLIKNAGGSILQTMKNAAAQAMDQLVTIPLVGNIVAGEPMPVPPSDFSYYDPDSAID